MKYYVIILIIFSWIVGCDDGQRVDKSVGSNDIVKDDAKTDTALVKAMTDEDLKIASLRWLADHQNEDGSWSADFHENCGTVTKTWQDKVKRRGTCKNKDGSSDSGRGFSNELLTGLALLAFHEMGYTFEVGQFKLTLKKGLLYLKAVQDENNCFAKKDDKYFLMTHAICTYAVTEAYAMTAVKVLRPTAELAIEYLIKAQNLSKDKKLTGWGLKPLMQPVDPITTCWAFLALESTQSTNFKVNSNVWEGIKNYLETNTKVDVEKMTIRTKTDVKFLPANAGRFKQMPYLDALNLLRYKNIDKLRWNNTHFHAQLKVFDDEDNMPDLTKKSAIDFMYWYFASRINGELGYHVWKKWKSKLYTAVTKLQRVGNKDADKCVFGSWDPIDAWGKAGGRVYATAMNCLNLTVHSSYKTYSEIIGSEEIDDEPKDEENENDHPPSIFASPPDDIEEPEDEAEEDLPRRFEGLPEDDDD